MSSWSKSVLGLLLTTVILCVGSVASAATSMYSVGSLSIKAFGNDTTDGLQYPQTTLIYLGIPFGVFCNEYAGTTPIECGGYYTTAQDGYPLTGAGSVSVSATGGGGGSFTLPEGQLARQLGQLWTQTIFPNASTTTEYTNPPTSTVTVMNYHPNTPRPVGGVPGGSFSYYFPYIYSYSYADLRNAAGNFFGGGGPGSFTFSLFEGTDPPAPAGKVTVTAGANQFGGTMRLLGFYRTNNAYKRSVGSSIGLSSNWLFTYVGAGYNTTGYTATGTNIGFNTGVGAAYTGFVKATAFPWTTGIASVTAARGPATTFMSYMKRSGYDNRTAGGSGHIQLVSPMLTHWTCPACGTDWETAGIGVMHLEMQVPEPANTIMLAAGISLLGLVYRATHRRS
ncbi:MAG: hypothetical protein JRE70_09485 [Deltaproteobacteria bacterium]|nr:hypothetical protein [Deltaproteobacteria bacterium]